MIGIALGDAQKIGRRVRQVLEKIVALTDIEGRRGDPFVMRMVVDTSERCHFAAR
jgi:hypothetical protein